MPIFLNMEIKYHPYFIKCHKVELINSNYMSTKHLLSSMACRHVFIISYCVVLIIEQIFQKLGSSLWIVSYKLRKNKGKIDKDRGKID